MLASAEEVIELLDLQPLAIEGGWYRENYRSGDRVPSRWGERSLATAIYYLLTPESFSEMHQLPGDELFHFYLGDAVEMLHLGSDGSIARPVMGQALERGETLQIAVRGGWWQGARLQEGGRFALLGTTMSPGFSYDDYQRGDRDDLIARFPAARDDIEALTRPVRSGSSPSRLTGKSSVLEQPSLSERVLS